MSRKKCRHSHDRSRRNLITIPPFHYLLHLSAHVAGLPSVPSTGSSQQGNFAHLLRFRFCLRCLPRHPPFAPRLIGPATLLINGGVLRPAPAAVVAAALPCSASSLVVLCCLVSTVHCTLSRHSFQPALHRWSCVADRRPPAALAQISRRRPFPAPAVFVRARCLPSHVVVVMSGLLRSSEMTYVSVTSTGQSAAGPQRGSVCVSGASAPIPFECAARRTSGATMRINSGRAQVLSRPVPLSTGTSRVVCGAAADLNRALLRFVHRRSRQGNVRGDHFDQLHARGGRQTHTSRSHGTRTR